MKHLIEQVNVGEKKSGTSKTGKPYTLWNIGLKINGTWYNNSVFKESYVKALEEKMFHNDNL